MTNNLSAKKIVMKDRTAHEIALQLPAAIEELRRTNDADPAVSVILQMCASKAETSLDALAMISAAGVTFDNMLPYCRLPENFNPFLPIYVATLLNRATIALENSSGILATEFHPDATTFPSSSNPNETH